MATRTRIDFGRSPTPNFFRPAPAAVHPADGPPTLGPDVRDRIGTELRAMYAALAREPVPERFVAFLRQLGSADPSS
jgi:hypothetical protein